MCTRNNVGLQTEPDLGEGPGRTRLGHERGQADCDWWCHGVEEKPRSGNLVGRNPERSG
jgi:hypothetical protein